jgi:hypothetical protein
MIESEMSTWVYSVPNPIGMLSVVKSIKVDVHDSEGLGRVVGSSKEWVQVKNIPLPAGRVAPQFPRVHRASASYIKRR